MTGAVILAGGQSRRMGRDKKNLAWGDTTFLKTIAGEIRHFDELLLSVAAGESSRLDGFLTIPDAYPDSGALGGLASALTACRSAGLLAVCCDMPLFKRDLAEYICSYISSDYDAIVLTDRSSRQHPLCGYYSKSALPALERQLKQGDLKLKHALTKLRVKEISLKHTVYGDETVANINTREEYELLLKQALPPPVIAVSGVKNSGKTTLLTGIIPLLKQAGLCLAVIKHDGHDFIPDVAGTDSFALRMAGAQSVAVYSDRRYLLTETRAGASPEDFIPLFSDADLILLEGGKNSRYDKIEVVRTAISSGPVCNPRTLLGLCTDADLHLKGIPTLELNDYQAVCALILDYLGRT